MLIDIVEDKKAKWKEEIEKYIEENYFENNDMEIDEKKKKKKKISTDEKDKKAEEIFKELEKSRITGNIYKNTKDYILKSFFSGEPKTAISLQIEKQRVQNTSEAIKNLNDIFETIQRNQNNNLLLNIAAGSIISKAKRNLNKEDFMNMCKKTKFSVSWCYFLCKLFKLSKIYKGLQQLCISIRFIYINFSIIKEYITQQKYSETWTEYS